MAKQRITKQIAESMARKIRQSLITKRKAIMDDFHIIAKDKMLIDDWSEKYIKAVKDMEKAKNELDKIVGRGMYVYNKESKDSLLNFVKNAYIMARVGDIPTTEEIIDDIMVDSFGSENANDIIKRITDSYASNFNRR